MEIDERGRLEREAGTSIGGLLRGCLTEKIAGKNRRTLSHEEICPSSATASNSIDIVSDVHGLLGRLYGRRGNIEQVALRP